MENLTTYSFSGVEEAAGPRIRVFFHFEHHRIYLGTTLIGRGTDVIGGRMGPLPESTELGNVKKLQQENDLVVETYWPEENRTSEVEILKKAREYGEKIDFIGDHIPEMVCHLDPNFLCSSTKTIRQFLGLSTDGSRRLRMIAFQRLLPIEQLEEKDMVTAYLQCFSVSTMRRLGRTSDEYAMETISACGRRGYTTGTSASGTWRGTTGER